ncbi:MAG TPA: acylphosphatase [Nitrososphaerales archaeon]|nr:acylphosphatase [Nitrososphaerales archaeon]
MTEGNSRQEIETIKVRVQGRVQGVFFRSSLKSLADSLGVRGWVKNLPDGAVEALIQGRREEVCKVLDWCKIGPKLAEVSEVNSCRIEPEMTFRNFAIIA